ncbi:MAG: response regulator [Zetaproteobacteria bacterium CG06_land_8_20_14_3_00_59_53]|nr:MAG: response regulator [Zetaproteobacteria bacterium CG2_30_59_37]PIO89256.1 MAG: response regulator [Zetaproteobacteria bacterium CG23_combo_of_CG06-09_8_20_14_all_59_86]PIQ66193.1 MAG: response regulator [Zetaproteobacteria bacterium CG11_big_fil_rev_8_21_14_0_20_59_439]PIU70535.1 MAG: response regulator [Zetaproteobacteria bacterium CG06_land_8_20_14_3_00_59_53]PIU97953.1 MAG: response regulator [Zetaproteobacteria bacterium CG03_land_8_20_14_0_80_59_51]PIY46945.1 MAG: response regulato
MARILIIDDEELFRQMLKQMLESAGHEVAEAADGEQGLTLFREQPADLVITDIFMPEKEGIATIHELKEEFPALKLIAVTGGGYKRRGFEYLEFAEKIGADRVLHKPFERQELLDAVEVLLGS